MQDLPLIVGLGEVLWDIFPNGAKFGGAPANFACHAANLYQALQPDSSAPAKGNVYMVSALGTDSLGDRGIESLSAHRVETRCVQRDSNHPTGTVHVNLDENGVANYTFADETAWDHLAWNEQIAKLAAELDVVCFGTLGQRSDSARQTIQRFVRSTKASAIRLFDINLRPPFYTEEVIEQSLRLANALKLNDDELPVVGQMCQASGDAKQQLQHIQAHYELQFVALTRGPKGALLVRGEESSDFEGVPTDVKDTVGAGDSFTAAMTLKLLEGESLQVANEFACRVAAYVCSQEGATPDLDDI